MGKTQEHKTVICWVDQQNNSFLRGSYEPGSGPVFHRVYLSQQPQKVGAVIIPILQMKRWRLQAADVWAQGHTAGDHDR